MSAHMRQGRPKKQASPSFYEKPFYQLLNQRMPEEFRDETGNLSVPKLAEALKEDVSRFTVYRWMNGENIRMKNAKKIITLSKDSIKLEELLPYLSQ